MYLNLAKSILIIFIFPCALLAQDYKQMLDTENEWHFTTCFFGCNDDVYFTDGDTTWNNTDYKILDGYHYISRTFWLREDEIERHIYLSVKEPGKARAEVLLYDFSLQVGDSIDLKNPISPFPTDIGYFKIDSIIEKPIFTGENRRHFYLSPCVTAEAVEYPVWIEGLGSLSLINAPGGTPDVNDVGKLSCFFKNGLLSYTQPDSTDICIAEHVVSVQEKSENLTTLYPTITADEITIRSSLFLSRIKLYALDGKCVAEFELDSDHENTISIYNQKSGIYILEVIFNNAPSGYHQIIKQ